MVSEVNPTLRGLFVETPTERFCGHVVCSKIRPATQKDLDAAEALHKLGTCQHKVVFDVPGWMYDTRVCYTCSKGLGTI